MQPQIRSWSATSHSSQEGLYPVQVGVNKFRM
jgi:hypothetical protein